jgi:hypothetical protein
MKKFLVVLLFVSLNCNEIREVHESDVSRILDSNGFTAEQGNVKRRIELASDANKIWWIYCLSDTGQVVFYGAVKGKITSSGKKLQMVETDGTAGESDAYVYWFDPSGAYYQWNGYYFVSSKEIKISNVVLNLRSIKE